MVIFLYNLYMFVWLQKIWREILLVSLLGWASTQKIASISGSVGCSSNWWSEGRGFEPRQVGNILSWRFDYEIFSLVILSLLLIQEGQLSVSDEKMCTILVKRLED